MTARPAAIAGPVPLREFSAFWIAWVSGTLAWVTMLTSLRAGHFSIHRGLVSLVNTTRPVEGPAKAASAPLPGAKETVTLRVDRDVLDFFQKDGPGWQDRIDAALRKAAGK